MKNIVFIPYIKRKESLGDSGVAKPRWDGGYDYVKKIIVNYL